MSEIITDDNIDTNAWSEFINEFQHESDRATAVLAGAFLENLLATILENFFIKDKSNIQSILYGFNAPLYSFHSKILCSYCLGLLPDDEFHDLKIIKKIRNDFAHKQAGLSFSSQSIADKCKKLTKVDILQRELNNIDLNKPRNRFIYGVALLTISLNSTIARPPDRCTPAKRSYLVISDKPIKFNR